MGGSCSMPTPVLAGSRHGTGRCSGSPRLASRAVARLTVAGQRRTCTGFPDLCAFTHASTPLPCWRRCRHGTHESAGKVCRLATGYQMLAAASGRRSDRGDGEAPGGVVPRDRGGGRGRPLRDRPADLRVGRGRRHARALAGTGLVDGRRPGSRPARHLRGEARARRRVGCARISRRTSSSTSRRR